MNPETSTPELNKALVAAQGEMPVVPFDSTNPFLKNRYASLGSVIATSRPILAKHGLAIEQKPYSRNGNVGVKTVMRHVSGECSESELDMPMSGEKGKSAIQEAGSVITYLRRYAWSAVCGLYADEDTDGNAPPTSAMAGSSSVKPKPVPAPHQTPKAPPAPSWTKRTPNEQAEHIARLEGWLGQCKAELLKRLEPVKAGADEYAAKAGIVLPGEALADATVSALFRSVNWDAPVDANKLNVKKDFDALTKAVQAFIDGDRLPDEDNIPMGDAPDSVPEINVPRDEHLDPNTPNAAQPGRFRS